MEWRGNLFVLCCGCQATQACWWKESHSFNLTWFLFYFFLLCFNFELAVFFFLLPCDVFGAGHPVLMWQTAISYELTDLSWRRHVVLWCYVSALHICDHHHTDSTWIIHGAVVIVHITSRYVLARRAIARRTISHKEHPWVLFDFFLFMLDSWDSM